jgi:hypothetical protein
MAASTELQLFKNLSHISQGDDTMNVPATGLRTKGDAAKKVEGRRALHWIKGEQFDAAMGCRIEHNIN